MAILYGWDASDFDHDRGARPAHLEKAYAEGIRFFTHKITESTNVVHRHAGEMVGAAVKAGIPFVGFYIVIRTPGNGGAGSVSAQVDFAIREATRQFPAWKTTKGFFWQVDLERWPYDSVAAKYGVEAAKLLRDRTDRKALLYASHGQYGNSIPGSDPLWNANYNGSGAPASFKTQWARTPQLNHDGFDSYSGRKPRILQYASDATIGGQRICDANVFIGSEADFAEMIGVSTAPPPVTNGVTAVKPRRVSSYAVDATPHRVVKVSESKGGSGVDGTLNMWSSTSLNAPAKLIAEIATYYPKIGDIYITSAVRNTPGDYHGARLWYGGSRAQAVDFGAYGSFSKKDDGQRAMRDFAKWWEDKIGAGNLIELIHTTPYSTDNGFYVKNGSKLGGYGYGPATNAAHVNHVHVAMSESTAKRVLAKLKKEYPTMSKENVYKAVWESDALESPSYAAKGNEYYAPGTYLKNIGQDTYDLKQEVKGLKKDLAELKELLAGLKPPACKSEEPPAV